MVVFLVYRMKAIRKKLVVVGDGQCGKTSILVVFKGDKFIDGYTPTVFDNYVADIEIDNNTVSLALWDTAGQEEYDRLRFLSYPDANCILVCFSVDSHDSYENVEEKWVPEVRRFCNSKVPIILVANKTDLRSDSEAVKQLKISGRKPLDLEDGKLLAMKIGAHAYVECSAKNYSGIRDVFETATRACLMKNNEVNSCCTIQ